MHRGPQDDGTGGGPWREAKSMVATIVLCLLLQATLVQAYHIPSGSMENTLLVGDVVVADKLTFGTQFPDRVPILSWKLPSVRIPGLRAPRPGELVIFESVEDPETDLIKRCVALAGQTVVIRDKGLVVDGVPFTAAKGQKHVDGRVWTGGDLPRDNFGPYVVPEGHFFAMGDNRDLSYDSRFFGPVPLTNVKARPIVIGFSHDPARAIWDLPGKVRWRRIGSFD
jgi:signal peptidase I